MYRDTYLHIDLDLLEENLDFLRKEWGPCEILAVLKANAYGHGAQVMAKALEEEGINHFGVAYLNEALDLRKVTKSDILLLSPSPMDQYQKIVEADLTQSISSYEEGLALIEAGKLLSKKARAEIKLETGFYRYGFPDSDKSIAEIEDLYKRGLDLLGLYSHLRLVGEEENQNQFNRLIDFSRRLSLRGVDLKLHIADSIASLKYPEFRLDRVRLGALIYGMTPTGSNIDSIKPIASLKTRVSGIKELKKGQGLGYNKSWIAQVDSVVGLFPLGYGDGLPRGLSNKGHVIIRGQKAPMIGLMNMDSFVVDLTNIEGVKLGDEALVFGTGQKGDMTLQIIAGFIDTNKNETLAKLQARLPRYYTKGEKSLYLDSFLGEEKGDLFK